MNFVVVISFAVCVAMCVSADTPSAEKLRLRALPALKHEETRDEHGQYALRYVTAEGTVVSENGYLVPTADNKDYVLAYKGETTVIGEDGKPIITKYTSDINGFKAEGEHIPTERRLTI